MEITMIKFGWPWSKVGRTPVVEISVQFVVQVVFQFFLASNTMEKTRKNYVRDIY